MQTTTSSCNADSEHATDGARKHKSPLFTRVLQLIHNVKSVIFSRVNQNPNQAIIIGSLVQDSSLSFILQQFSKSNL